MLAKHYVREDPLVLADVDQNFIGSQFCLRMKPLHRRGIWRVPVSGDKAEDGHGFRRRLNRPLHGQFIKI